MCWCVCNAFMLAHTHVHNFWGFVFETDDRRIPVSAQNWNYRPVRTAYDAMETDPRHRTRCNNVG